MLPHPIYRGRAKEWSTGLNYAAADCQVELRTMGHMLKYGSLCVCVCKKERKKESTLVNVRITVCMLLAGWVQHHHIHICTEV